MINLQERIKNSKSIGQQAAYRDFESDLLILIVHNNGNISDISQYVNHDTIVKALEISIDRMQKAIAWQSTKYMHTFINVSEELFTLVSLLDEVLKNKESEITFKNGFKKV